MTPVGLAGIFLGFLGWPLGMSRPSANRIMLFMAILAVHVAASVAYYLYVQTTSADSSLYYFDRHWLRNWDFAFGTVFTVKLVQTVKDMIGGSYLDYFLIFQAIGFWGIALMLRTFQEIHEKLQVPATTMSYCLLFLPGVHFWTSAVGKDAPLFFAISLAVWSSMRLSRRTFYLAMALAVMVLFRPHIALIAGAALALTELFNPRSGLVRKGVLLVVAFAALAVIAGTVRTTFQVDVTSASSLSDFFERQETVAQTIGGTTTVADASYLVKLPSLLFRPFFFDAEGPMGLIASIENLAWVFLVGFLIFHLGSAIRLSRNIFFLRFCLIFAGLLTVLLALVFYNVGLAARQKTMIVPPLFAFFVALWAARRFRLYAAPVTPRAVALAGGPPELTGGTHA